MEKTTVKRRVIASKSSPPFEVCIKAHMLLSTQQWVCTVGMQLQISESVFFEIRIRDLLLWLDIFQKKLFTKLFQSVI